MTHRMLLALLAVVAAPALAAAQPAPPEYYETYLASIFPAGGQRGQTLQVEIRGPSKSLRGKELHGLKGALGVIVDGPPGISVGKIANVSDTAVSVELSIAPDAVPGRRMLRVVSRRSGLTSFSYFVVGTLPEVVEQEKNNELASAQQVPLPVVVNGVVNPALDVDCFRFSVRKGQTIACAVVAHSIDSRIMNPRSFVDAALEVLDSEGRIVADAADTLGLDPVVEFTPPADGDYTARVKLVNYQGYPDAVYRLTLTDGPFPMTGFPVAIERGKTAQIAFTGANLSSPQTASVTAPAEPDLPVLFASSAAGTHDLPLLVSDVPEAAEQEPNRDRETATVVEVPQGVSGRFDQADDEDWYRVRLSQGASVRCEIHAQRYLRSPVDTLIEVFDSSGASLQKNDDLASTDVEMLHDFEPFDSLLVFKAPKDGDYFIRVLDQTGTFGPQAVYHLSIAPTAVDVELHAWPDAVPIWGPGNTAAFVATLDRVGAVTDVELEVEGLPDGWIGSRSIASAVGPTRRALLTITAPEDAKPGDVAEFRVVGRFTAGDKAITREAQPLTAYMPNDRHHCRISPKLRTAVAEDIGLRLAAEESEIVAVQGKPAEVAVRVSGVSANSLPLSVNMAGGSFKCNLGVQQKAAVSGGIAKVRIACENLQAGSYAIVVALAWDSELRKGLPGPCTQVIHLRVVPATARVTQAR